MIEDSRIICTFKFQCDKQWEELSKISENRNVRYCSDCRKPVFMCNSYEELAEHAERSECIAFKSHYEREILVGEIASPYDTSA